MFRVEFDQKKDTKPKSLNCCGFAICNFFFLIVTQSVQNTNSAKKKNTKQRKKRKATKTKKQKTVKQKNKKQSNKKTKAHETRNTIDLCEEVRDLIFPSNHNAKIVCEKRVGPRASGVTRCQVKECVLFCSVLFFVFLQQNKNKQNNNFASWEEVRVVVENGEQNRFLEHCDKRSVSHRGHAFLECVVERKIDPLGVQLPHSARDSTFDPVTCRLLFGDQICPFLSFQFCYWLVGWLVDADKNTLFSWFFFC